MKNFDQTEDQQKEQVSRTCIATGCPMFKCANDKCMFHNAFPFSAAGYVTRKLKQSEVACKTDDGRTYTITYAQAAKENRALMALDCYNETERLGENFYPVREIAYREFATLWRAGLIPDEVKEKVRDASTLYNALLMRGPYRIKLSTGEMFCTDWLCMVYEHYLIDQVGMSVPDERQAPAATQDDEEEMLP